MKTVCHIVVLVVVEGEHVVTAAVVRGRGCCSRRNSLLQHLLFRSLYTKCKTGHYTYSYG